MAKKKKANGSGNVADLTIEILRSIRDEIAGLRADTNARFHGLEGRFDRLEGEIVKMREDLVSLETATIRGFEGVSARLDNIVGFSGERWQDHEQRIRKLEQHVPGR